MEVDGQIIDLRNKILLGIFIFIIFFIPVVAIFATKFGEIDTDVINKLNKEDTFIILFTKEECDYCKNTIKILKDENIKYEEIKTDSERYYNTIINKLEISNNYIIEPTIMYIKEGRLSTSLVDINNKKDLLSYIENNNLTTIE